jgi:hypothetical protein
MASLTICSTLSTSGRFTLGPMSGLVMGSASRNPFTRATNLSRNGSRCPVQVHALVAGADLPAIGEARHDGGFHRGLDVRVFEHDERSLAAELQADDLQFVAPAA